jgi:hypothetical protein
MNPVTELIEIIFGNSNKTDHHDIAEILLKVALNTINLNHILVLSMISISDNVHIFKQ